MTTKSRIPCLSVLFPNEPGLRSKAGSSIVALFTDCELASPFTSGAAALRLDGESPKKRPLAGGSAWPKNKRMPGKWSKRGRNRSVREGMPRNSLTDVGTTLGFCSGMVVRQLSAGCKFCGPRTKTCTHPGDVDLSLFPTNEDLFPPQRRGPVAGDPCVRGGPVAPAQGMGREHSDCCRPYGAAALWGPLSQGCASLALGYFTFAPPGRAAVWDS